MLNDKTLIEYLNDSLTIFKKGGFVLPKIATANIYHHRGKNFLRETGALFINVVNREYCKSYVVMLAGQVYPNHYHIQKAESCYILYGDFFIDLDGKTLNLSAGELVNIDRRQSHSFGTKGGVIFEEISTTYVPNDSIYLDEKIKNASYAERRTTLTEKDWSEIISKWNR